MDHDFYNLFTRFWWLVFPLFWMGTVIAAQWSRHKRANRALDIIKTYADQGKDPPPELLKTLQSRRGDCSGWDYDWRGGWRYAPARLLQRTFLFGALAIGFGILAFDHGDHYVFGLLIPFVIFVALALSSGLSLLLNHRDLPPSDRDGPPR